VFAEAGCEFVCASSEACRTQPNMTGKTIFFIKKPFEMKPPQEMRLSGYNPCASLKSPPRRHRRLNAENNFRTPFRRRANNTTAQNQTTDSKLFNECYFLEIIRDVNPFLSK
jgi:hypothetical protein